MWRTVTRWRAAQIVLLIIIGAMMLVALARGQRHPEAERQRQLDMAQRLAAQAEGCLDGNPSKPVLGALLAIESARRHPTVAGDQALRRALADYSGATVPMVHGDTVWAVVFGPDGRWLATGSADRTARVWRLEAPGNEGTLVGREAVRLEHRHWVVALAFSPDGRWLATGSLDGIAKVWRIEVDATDNLALREVLELSHGAAVFDLTFSPDGQWLVTGSGDCTARVLLLRGDSAGEFATWEEIARLPHDIWVEDLTFSPDGQWLATTSGGIVRVWRVSSGLLGEVASWSEALRTRYSHVLWKVAFSPDSRCFVAGSIDGAVRVWHLESDAVSPTWQEITTLDQGSLVSDIAFGPQGRWLATAGGLDGIVRVWRIVQGSAKEPTAWPQVARMAHDAAVDRVSFGPEGRWLVTLSGKSVRVWALAPGVRPDESLIHEAARLTHESKVTAMALSPDDRWLATGSEDSTARVRLWRPADLIASLCARLPRNLTREEWRRYLPGESYRATCAGLS